MKKKICKKINPVVTDFLNKVQELLEKRLKKVILYGSYARGDYNNLSDIDSMILTDFSDAEIEDGKIQTMMINIKYLTKKQNNK